MNIYACPHLDGIPAAYRHHLADNLSAWRPLLDGVMSTVVAGAASWFAYHHLDPFWGAAMVGGVIFMGAALVRDAFGWPLYEAIRSQQWFGPDRIVHRAGVGPVQVVDVDVREDLEQAWVLVARLGSADAPAVWVPVSELAPTPDGLTGDEEAQR